MSKNNFSPLDRRMMEEALKEARVAFEKDEVPVGSVLGFQEKIIARAHNQVESLKDPSAHAELLCIRSGAKTLKDWRLLEATLYTTLEPCLMCAGALLLSRVKRVVWGAPDLRHGAHGSYLNVFEMKHPTHTLQIEGGLMEEESSTLMKEFFKKQRNRKTMKKSLRDLFDELLQLQEKKLLNIASSIIPNVTSDDILQPNDYPELEHHPFFRYEEGVLKGLHAAKMAVLAHEKDPESL